MNTPLVSIVIPACNAAIHLGKTLESVSAQTFRSIEVIVVDDGSTDATPVVAAAAQANDPRVRVVRQRNAGVGTARNTGIRLARGKYIAPLDADDLWCPQKLERQVARIERAGPRAGLAYCWSRNIDEQGRLISWSHPYRIEGRVGSAMMLGNFPGSASVPLFRASALKTVGLYLTRDEQDGAQGCEDWDLNVRIAEHFALCCVPEYDVSYRQSAASMSMHTRNMARSYEIVMRHAFARNPHLPASLRSWSDSRFYSYLVSKCYCWSDYPGTLYFLGKLLRVDPISWIHLRNHRIGALALAHLISGGKLRRHRAPPPVSDPLFQQPPPAVPPTFDLFAQIEERRLDVALQARHGIRPRAVKIKGAFGY